MNNIEITKPLLNAIIPTILVFIADAIISTLTLTNGYIQINEPIYVNDNYIYSINIENVSSHTINNIQLNVSNPIEKSRFFSNSHFLIDHVRDSVYSINDIQPKSKVDIIISLKSKIEISTINTSDINIEVEHSSTPRNTVLDKIEDSFVMSIYYFIFAFIVFAFIQQRITHLSNETNRYRDELKTSNKNVEEQADKIEALQFELKELSNKNHRRISKLKSVMVVRMIDLQKENNFWKDTIRKLLYNFKSKQEIDSIFTAIRSTLKTHSTAKGSDEFETIFALSKFVDNQD